jgi:hypothetical protein
MFLFLLTLLAHAADLRGVIVESLPAAGYTYTRVRSADGSEFWAAAPGKAPAVGTQVDVSTGLPMARFHSDALKRDFDMVYFIGSFSVVGKAAAIEVPAWHPKVAEGEECPPVSAEQIATAIATNGGSTSTSNRTVVQVWTERAALSGKRVTLKGEVVKFTAGVMGRNWIHVRDGTGDATTNDLVVTTNAIATPGQRVSLTGTVLVDQDFGYGYKYAVLVSDASVTTLDPS